MVEAVFEDLAVKQTLFRELDKLCRPDAILATNTSALPITQVAAVTAAFTLEPGGPGSDLTVALPTPDRAVAEAIAARLAPRLRRGIPVSAAGDNCRDSFHAYGDHDVVDTFRQAVRILHYDHPVTGAAALVGATPSAVGGFSGHGRIAAGAPAHLIVFNARSINEIISRPQSDRIVIRDGLKVSAQAPDYSEFWQDDAAIAEQ